MCGQALKMIGELASTSKQIRTVHRLIATWRYLFVDNIRDMPGSELIEHRIPLYPDATPNVAKPVLYTSEEVTWQMTNLPKLLEAGIIGRKICRGAYLGPLSLRKEEYGVYKGP